LRLLFACLAIAGCLAAETGKLDTSTPHGQAFARMYNFDFAGAHAILDRQIRQDPDFALSYAAKAAAHFFSELHRLKILQMDFFEDDDKLVDRRKLIPDPAIQADFFRLIEMARARANARLATHPQDRDALVTLCMAAGLVSDYAALVERRRFGSFALSRETQAQALKLLALDPPYYDARLSMGSTEYVVGSLPFYLRWFVRIHQIEGSKKKAVEHLQLVAERGRYYGPFARILLSVIHLREKRPAEAERLLADLVAEFPENPLLRRELARAGGLARRSIAAGPARR
jgi:hypothetical protein